MYKKDNDVFRWEWLDTLTNPDQTKYPKKGKYSNKKPTQRINKTFVSKLYFHINLSK